MTGPAVGVVTVTYSPGDTLEVFLTSLATATHRPIHIVLADNGSTDGAPQRAAATHPVLTLLETGANLGYGTGANRGVAVLPTEIEWIVVANPDIRWQPGALDTLLNATTRWPHAAAFGPLIRQPDGRIYPSAWRLPTLGRGIGHATLGRLWPGNPWTRAYHVVSVPPVERVAGWVSGACLLLRRAAFDQVGGFDERYFMYFEDVDLADRLARAGWRSVYVPAAEVTHLGGHATRRAPARMTAAHHRSAYRYLADRHVGPAWLPLRAVLRVALALRLSLTIHRAAGSGNSPGHGTSPKDDHAR